MYLSTAKQQDVPGGMMNRQIGVLESGPRSKGIPRGPGKQGWLASIFLAVTLAGCTPDGPKHVAWTEDVQLDERSQIRVSRTVTVETFSSMSGDATAVFERDATISFEGAYAKYPKWQQPLAAVLLYQDTATDELVIVAKSSDCAQWRQKGKPMPPYWEYREKGGVWVEQPLSQASIGRPTNLLVSPLKLQRKQRHVTVEDRRALNGYGMARVYREIWGDPDQLYCGHGHKQD
jgi:hypothetical protein